MEENLGFLEKNKFTIGVLLAGIILAGLGFLGVKIFNFVDNQPKVEILGENDNGSGPSYAKASEGNTKITVEVAGEVLRPGVYELAVGSRVNDLLTMAGGLTAEADREYVSKSINLAQKITDGGKIYIPKKGGNIGDIREVGEVGGKININIATEKELDTLWGVGEATVKKIILARPYQKPEELLEKKIVKSNVWEKIKEEITVY